MLSICIVISTYNGERYLREQIESLEKQTVAITRIHIRDDGSTDATPSIIVELARQYPNITYELAENTGWMKGFILALDSCPGYDWYAFSDQDDKWMPDKVEHALQVLSDHRAISFKKPTLYAGNVTITDANLKPLELRNPEPVDIETRNLPQTMTRDDMAGGLTYVFNDVARNLLVQFEPMGRTGHDRTLMLICKTFGKVVYDFESKLLYRQHGSNVYGGFAAKEAPLYKKIFNWFNESERYRQEIATGLLALQKVYKLDSTEIDKKYLELCSGYKNSISSKVKMLLYKNPGGKNFLEDIKLRLRILNNTY